MIDPKLVEVRSWLAKAWQEEPFEKTHSLVALVGMCLKFSDDFNVLRDAATTLTPFAVTTRYPGGLPEISLQEARDALDHARQVWNFVLARLPEKACISFNV
jgi:hypothetical protein